MPRLALTPLHRPAQTFHVLHVWLPLVACLIATAAMTYLLYATTGELFRAGVDERLIGLASVAALQFDAGELDQIHGPESVDTDVYRAVVRRLAAIRRETPNVRFAYILRQTVDPFSMEFVADSDSLEPEIPLDLNHDGVIDDRDALAWPGDPYDVSNFPEFRQAAFERAFVDPELTHDQWGTFLAGTAPVRNAANALEPARYVLGLDMDVSEFEALTQRAFRPFVFFAAFVLFLVTTLTLGLAALWRHQVHQLAEIDRQKDELIGVVAHQLNGPVTIVRWSLEEMLAGEQGDLMEPQRAQLQKVQDAIQHLGDLTSLLLDVSRIELGRLPVNPSETDLEPFLTHLVADANLQALKKGVRLAAELPPRRSLAVLDPRLTGIALENLLANAVKYTSPGGDVRFAATIHGGVLHCEISDTGIGIPIAEQPLIFGKLFRASNARAVPGNGFGLYIAKGAIEQQGGRLSFRSRGGEGTSFMVEIPIRGNIDAA